MKTNYFDFQLNDNALKIITDVTVYNSNNGSSISCKALWSAGHTQTIISNRLVKILELESINNIKHTDIFDINHTKETDEYIIDLEFHHNMNKICGRRTIGLDIYDFKDQYDIIIGMDIISSGNFSLKQDQETGKNIISFSIN